MKVWVPCNVCGMVIESDDYKMIHLCEKHSGHMEFKMRVVLLIMFILVSFGVQAYPNNPTSNGSICKKSDSHFKELRYVEKIPYCKRAVSESKRKYIYKSYGIAWEDREHYSIDHYLPLSIGGSNHLNNLWPEHLSLKMKRGKLEIDLYYAMKNGRMLQIEAVWIIKYSKTNDKVKRYCGNLEAYRKLYSKSVK